MSRHVQDDEWLIFLIIMAVVVITMLFVIGNVKKRGTSKNNVNVVDTVFVYPDSSFFKKSLMEHLE